MSEQSKRYDTTAGQEELRQSGLKPRPKPDELTRPYWDAVARHALEIQWCAECGNYQHPPAPACKKCCKSDLAWEPISGRAVVYSFIVDRRLLVPGFTEPYVVAQVNPVEATRDTVRITANIRGCAPEAVYIGMPVEVVFEDLAEGFTLPQFRPAHGESQSRA